MQSRIVVIKIRSKMAAYPSQGMQIKMVNSLQNPGKVFPITLNIQESFYNQGKLGKAFSHLSTRKGFRSSRKGFANHFPNLGKLLKILGKVSLQNYPGKGKGKLSVLPLNWLQLLASLLLHTIMHLQIVMTIELLTQCTQQFRRPWIHITRRLCHQL